MGCAKSRGKQEEKVLNYLVLGLEGAGKTSVLRAYEGVPFDESPDPTTMASISEFKKHEYLLRTVECAGTKEGRKAWHEAYDICSYDALVFVIDGSNPNGFAEAKEELKSILLSNYEEIENIPVAVFVNKADLGPKVDAKELSSVVKDAAKGRRNFAKVYVVSAKTGQNISKGFEDLSGHLNPRCCCLETRHEKPKKISTDPSTPHIIKSSPKTEDTTN